MKLSEALNKWKDHWIAFQISTDGDDPEGEVILHETDRDRFRSLLKGRAVANLYITFAGAPLPNGYSALF